MEIIQQRSFKKNFARFFCFVCLKKDFFEKKEDFLRTLQITRALQRIITFKSKKLLVNSTNNKN